MSKAVDGHVWRAYVWPGEGIRLERLKGRISPEMVLFDELPQGAMHIRRGRRGVDVFDTAEEALQAFIRLTQLDVEHRERQLAFKRENIRQAEEKLLALRASDGGAK